MIQVVDRAFDVLEYLSQRGEAVGGTELARAMGISIQCANNLLRTLYRRGYVSQDESRNYRLGAQCVYLGSFADRWAGLRRCLDEPMRRLADRSGMTAFSGVLENDRLLCVALRSPEGMLSAPPRQSWWNELHSTACGRVLLASLTAAGRKKLFARSVRGKMTESTVTDPETLESLCQTVAAQGYAEVCGESRREICSLALPLRDSAGRVVAGLAISACGGVWMKTTLETKLDWLRSAASIF